MFFFGPDVDVEPPPRPIVDADIRPIVQYRPPTPELPSATGSARKHARDSALFAATETTPRPTQKRGRIAGTERNNGMLNQPSTPAAMTVTDAGSAMEVDQVNGHDMTLSNGKPHPSAYEGPPTDVHSNVADGQMEIDMEGAVGGTVSIYGQAPQQTPEPAPLPPSTLTNGLTVGVQVAPAKIADLAPTTTILAAPEGEHVMNLGFSQPDSQYLVAAGEHFCVYWKNKSISAGTLGTPSPCKDLIDASEEVMVTALAWEPTRLVLVVATYDNQFGQLHIFGGRNLALIEVLPASSRPITSMKWMPSGRHLIAVCASDETKSTSPTASSLLLWDLNDLSNPPRPSTLLIADTILDLEIANLDGHDLICAAGDAGIYQCAMSQDVRLQVERAWQPPTPASWTFVKCAVGARDPTVDVARDVIVAVSAEAMCLWLPNHGTVREQIHKAPITGLQLRPSSSSALKSHYIHDFATSSMDGTVKLWRLDEAIRALSTLATVAADVPTPIMALSYSPDGFCVAAASYDTVRIWNPDSSSQPIALWDAPNQVWSGARLRDEDTMSLAGRSSVNGDHGSTADHCLSWDLTSKKLAFGLASQASISTRSNFILLTQYQIAILNFQH